jgi:Tfp pilus assembly protein PilF
MFSGLAQARIMQTFSAEYPCHLHPESINEGKTTMMHKWIICLLMTALVAAWSAAAAAQNVPEEARRYMARGIAAIEMAKSTGDYVLAALEFEKAAKLAPDWPEVYYSLGSVQAKMGDPASAVKSYQRYLELAPRSPDAEKVRQEIYKLEYLHDRQKQAAALSGAWKASSGQTFKLLLDGPRLQLTRDEQQGDDVITIKSMGTHTGPMTDAPQLVFLGNLIEGKVTGLYVQAAGKSTGHCLLPERSGTFQGTVDSAAGEMRIVYKRVTLEYEMEFKSILSDELICRQTDRKETPGYVLELKRIP